MQTSVPPYRQLIPKPDGSYKLRTNMHPGQSRAWRHVLDPAIIRLVLSCGSQSGKTCFGPDVVGHEIDTHLETNPTEQFDYLAVSSTHKLMSLKMLPQLKEYFEIYHQSATHKEQKNIFESVAKTQMGQPLWRIILGSADNPESLESATAIGAWLDEPGQKQFKREAHEAVERRVSLRNGRILYTTTPYVPGWFLKDVYEPAMKGEKGSAFVNFKSIDNPAFSRAAYEAQKAKMPRWKFRMFYDGVYEQPAGIIYDCFSSSQIVPRFEIPLNWPRYWGHDFGPVHTAAVGYAIEPATGNMFLYYTYKSESKGSAHDHVTAWRKALRKDAKGNIIETIMKRVGGAHGETGWRESYTAEGWPIVEPKITGPGSVELQIDRVYGLRKLNKVFVFADLEPYIDELQSFSRELDDSYNPTEKIEDEASKHWMASDRYILSDFTPETVAKGKGSDNAYTWRSR
ncbi:MAG: terminase [Dehalococcoidia bacterium]|nr:terminase [Dehalococcoidia bacterium]